MSTLSAGAPRRISTTSNGTNANSNSGGGVFSPDGTKVAFWSYAGNLVPGDTLGRADVFLKDLETGAVARVSTDAAGTFGDGHSLHQIAFGVNGDFVAFYSFAANFASGDTNGVGDLFLKDLVRGDLFLVSAGQTGVPANNFSQHPSFSPDGTRIAFMSTGSDLLPGDTNGVADIFVVDLINEYVLLASAAANGTLGNGNSIAGSFSPDGTKIVFRSNANNFVTGDSNNGSDVFVKDLATGLVTRVSTSASGAQGVYPAGLSSSSARMAEFSPDGGSVLFDSRMSGLVAGDANDADDIFVKNLATGAVTRVSTDSSGAQANAGNFGEGSYAASFSPDGKRIVFLSGATNLVAGDTNDSTDAFVKDLVTGSIVRVSANGVGATISNIGFGPKFSPDGREVVFTGGDNHVYVAPIVAGGTTLSISQEDAVYVEGLAGPRALLFTVSRTGDLSGTSNANWTVTGAGLNAAEAEDFWGGALPTGSVTFAAGERTKTIAVNVAGNTLAEGDESFFVTLSTPTGANIGTARAMGLILEDDWLPAPPGTAQSLYTWYFHANSGDLYTGWLADDSTLYAPDDVIETTAGRYVIQLETEFGRDVGITYGTVWTTGYFDSRSNGWLSTNNYYNIAASSGQAGLGSELDSAWDGTRWQLFGEAGIRQADRIPPDSFYGWIFQANSGDFYQGFAIDLSSKHAAGDVITTAHGRYTIQSEAEYGWTTGLTGTVWTTGYFDTKGGRWLNTQNFYDYLASSGQAGLGSELDHAWTGAAWKLYGAGGAHQADAI